MNKIEFIYFDVGGVLIDWSNVFKTASDKFNLTVNDIDTTFEENNEEITKGLMNPKEFWERCIEKYNISDAESYDFLNSWVSDYRPISQTHELINRLKTNYKIGLLSNIYKGMLPLLLEKKLIPNIDYQSIIFSCDVGLRKPEAGIYELAQMKAQTEAKNILLVDDRNDYVEGAKKLNWNTFLFDTVQIDKTTKELENYLI